MTKNVPPMIVALVVGLAIPLFAQLSKDAAIAKAEAILKNLQDGKTAEIVKDFERPAHAGPAGNQTEGGMAWASRPVGAFKSITDRREGQLKDRQAVELVLAFEKETIIQRAVFDTEGKVAGLVFRPLSSAVLPASK
jgi:hypothetical protein